MQVDSPLSPGSLTPEPQDMEVDSPPLSLGSQPSLAPASPRMDVDALEIGTLNSSIVQAGVFDAQDRYADNKEYYDEQEVLQIKEEIAIVEGGVVCPVQAAAEPSTLDGQLEKTLREDFFDAEKAQDVLCRLNAVFYGPVENSMAAAMLTSRVVIPQRPPGMEVEVPAGTLPPTAPKSMPMSIRSSLKEPKIIGKPSADGIAATVDVGETKAAFVLKAPRDPGAAELLTHELVVGLELNKLRPIVPNFAYIYGGFKCSPPELGDGKKVEQWCASDKDAVRYVLYENISPGEDFEDFCETCTTADFLQMYVQTLLAVQKASELLGFTHNDLHPGNLFVRQYSEKIYIPYETPGGTVFVHTDKIATLIDYGRSTIAANGRSYGDYGQFRAGHSNVEAPFFMNDAYKLLMFSYLSLIKNKDRNVFLQLAPIFDFFNREESLVDALAVQREFYYVYPYTVPVANAAGTELSLYDLVDYIVQSYPEFRIILGEDAVASDSAVYSCYGESTRSVCRTRIPAGPLTAIDYSMPRDLFELYSLLPYLPKGRVDAIREQAREEGTDAAIIAARGRADIAASFANALKDLDVLRDKIVLYDDKRAAKAKAFFRRFASLGQDEARAVAEEFALVAGDYMYAVYLLNKAHYVAGMQDYFIEFLTPDYEPGSRKFVADIYEKDWKGPIEAFVPAIQAASPVIDKYASVHGDADTGASGDQIAIAWKVIRSFLKK